MSRRSCMCIGLGSEEEARVGSLVQTDNPRSFFALAQRVTWGLTQPDLVRVDVDAAVRDLLRRHSESFAAHLIAGAACRGRNDVLAEEHLDRARQLAGTDASAARWIPTRGVWEGKSPPQHMEEVVEGRVWRIRCDFPSVGVPFPNVSIGTLVRAEHDDLVFINPVHLEEDVLNRVRELGPVRWLVIQGKGHSRFVPWATAAFPQALVLGSKGHLNHPASSHLRFHHFVDDQTVLPDEFSVFPILGTDISECLLFHQPTKLLILQDLVAHAANNPDRPFFSRLYSAAFGVVDRIGWHGYQPIAWSNIKLMHQSLRPVLAADFDRVTGAHWPVQLEGGAAAHAFRDAVQWLLDLSPVAHKALLGRYFMAQPGFLRDLLTYRARSRRLETQPQTATPRGT